MRTRPDPTAPEAARAVWVSADLSCRSKPPKATKAALLLSSASPNVYDGAIGQYKSTLAYMGIEDAGIVTAAGEENGTDEKIAEIRAIAKAL